MLPEARTRSAEPPPPPNQKFSIISGGPWNELARRLHLLRPDGVLRVWRLVAFAWVPLVLATAVRMAFGRAADPMMLDLSVHVRFLVSLPLLVVSERLLEPQCRVAIDQLYTGRFADPHALDTVLARAERMRDRPWAELVLAALALAGGQLVLWGVAGPTGLFHGIDVAQTSFARIWYTALALPLLQFLTLRWLWRWLLWCWILWRLSRLPLAGVATHPDGAAGLGFLGAPVTGFAAFVLAFSSMLAAAWGTQLIDGYVTTPSLLPSMILFLVIAFLASCGPLLPFSLHLFNARRQALAVYSPFALDYVRDFHHKWIDQRGGEPVLGTPDLQSLADLGNSYRVIETTGLFLFSTRKLTELWLAAIIPMLPLALTQVSVEVVVRRIGSALFGGLI